MVTKEKYLSRKRKLLFEIEKKRKLKLKPCQKLQPISDEQELSSSRQNQSSAILKLRNYVFTKTWKLAVASVTYLVIWK